jgi:hypothetical protein
LKLAAEANWVTKAIALNPPADAPAPPAFPSRIAMLSAENSGRLTQNKMRKTRCNQSYPQTANSAASNDMLMAEDNLFNDHKVCSPSERITVATTL